MNPIRALSVCLATAVLAPAASPAFAEPVTFTFGGTVTLLEIAAGSPGPPPPWDSIAPGDPWSMAFTFESTTPNTSPPGNVATYPGAITSFTFTIGDEFVSTTPEEGTTIVVADDMDPIGDRYAVGIAFMDLVLGERRGLLLDLQDNQAVALASNDLPNDRLDLDAFASLREFRFQGGAAESVEWTWIGDVTVHDVIPQPDVEIFCPPDVELACGAPSDPSSTGTATGSSNTVVTYSDATAPSLCASSRSIERTWTATDVEGNAVSCVQTIAFVDCGLSLLPELLAFLDSLDTTPLFGDMTGLLRGLNDRRKQELIARALATRALLESGDRAGALDQLAWMRERMDGELLGLLDWVKGRAAAEGRTRVDEIVGEVEDCGL